MGTDDDEKQKAVTRFIAEVLNSIEVSDNSLLGQRFYHAGVVACGLEFIAEIAVPDYHDRFWVCRPCCMAGATLDTVNEHIFSRHHLQNCFKFYVTGDNVPLAEIAAKQIAAEPDASKHWSIEYNVLLNHVLNFGPKQPAVFHIDGKKLDIAKRLKILLPSLLSLERAWVVEEITDDHNIVCCKTCNESFITYGRYDTDVRFRQAWEHHQASTTHLEAELILTYLKEVEAERITGLPTGVVAKSDVHIDAVNDISYGPLVGLEFCTVFGEKNAFCALCFNIVPTSDLQRHFTCETHIERFVRRNKPCLTIGTEFERKGIRRDNIYNAVQQVIDDVPKQIYYATKSPLPSIVDSFCEPWNPRFSAPTIVETTVDGKTWKMCPQCNACVDSTSWDSHVTSDAHLDLVFQWQLVQHDKKSFINELNPLPQNTKAQKGAVWYDREPFVDVQNHGSYGFEFIFKDSTAQEYVCSCCYQKFEMNCEDDVVLHTYTLAHIKAAMTILHPQMAATLMNARNALDLKSMVMDFLQTIVVPQKESKLPVFDPLTAFILNASTRVPKLFLLLEKTEPHMRAESLKDGYVTDDTAVTIPPDAECTAMTEALALTDLLIASTNFTVFSFYCSACEFSFSVNFTTMLDIWTEHLLTRQHWVRSHTNAAEKSLLKVKQPKASPIIPIMMINKNKSRPPWIWDRRFNRYHFSLNNKMSLEDIVQREERQDLYCTICCEVIEASPQSLTFHVNGFPHVMFYAFKHFAAEITGFEQVLIRNTTDILQARLILRNMIGEKLKPFNILPKIDCYSIVPRACTDERVQAIVDQDAQQKNELLLSARHRARIASMPTLSLATKPSMHNLATVLLNQKIPIVSHGLVNLVFSNVMDPGLKDKIPTYLHGPNDPKIMQTVSLTGNEAMVLHTKPGMHGTIMGDLPAGLMLPAPVPPPQGQAYGPEAMDISDDEGAAYARAQQQPSLPPLPPLRFKSRSRTPPTKLPVKGQSPSPVRYSERSSRRHLPSPPRNRHSRSPPSKYKSRRSSPPSDHRYRETRDPRDRSRERDRDRRSRYDASPSPPPQSRSSRRSPPPSSSRRDRRSPSPYSSSSATKRDRSRSRSQSPSVKRRTYQEYRNGDRPPAPAVSPGTFQQQLYEIATGGVVGGNPLQPMVLPTVDLTKPIPQIMDFSIPPPGFPTSFAVPPPTMMAGMMQTVQPTVVYGSSPSLNNGTGGGFEPPPPTMNQEDKLTYLKMVMYQQDLEKLRYREDLVNYILKQNVEDAASLEDLYLNIVLDRKNGILGANLVYHVRCYQNPDLDTFLCSICKVWTTPGEMLKHLVTADHRMMFMSKLYKFHHAKAKLASDKHKRAEILAKAATAIEKIEGKKKVAKQAKVILNEALIAQFWPEYEEYVDNSWKLDVDDEEEESDRKSRHKRRSDSPDRSSRSRRDDRYAGSSSRRRSRSRTRSRSPKRSSGSSRATTSTTAARDDRPIHERQAERLQQDIFHLATSYLGQEPDFMASSHALAKEPAPGTEDNSQPPLSPVPPREYGSMGENSTYPQNDDSKELSAADKRRLLAESERKKRTEVASYVSALACIRQESVTAKGVKPDVIDRICRNLNVDPERLFSDEIIERASEYMGEDSVYTLTAIAHAYKNPGEPVPEELEKNEPQPAERHPGKIMQQLGLDPSKISEILKKVMNAKFQPLDDDVNDSPASGFGGGGGAGGAANPVKKNNRSRRGGVKQRIRDRIAQYRRNGVDQETAFRLASIDEGLISPAAGGGGGGAKDKDEGASDGDDDLPVAPPPPKRSTVAARMQVTQPTAEYSQAMILQMGKQGGNDSHSRPGGGYNGPGEGGYDYYHQQQNQSYGGYNDRQSYDEYYAPPPPRPPGGRGMRGGRGGGGPRNQGPRYQSPPQYMQPQPQAYDYAQYQGFYNSTPNAPAASTTRPQAAPYYAGPQVPQTQPPAVNIQQEQPTEGFFAYDPTGVAGTAKAAQQNQLPPNGYPGVRSGYAPPYQQQQQQPPPPPATGANQQPIAEATDWDLADDALGHLFN